MKINPTGIDLRRSELTKSVQTPADSGKKQGAGSSSAASATRSDQVQISNAGRALASQAATGAGQTADVQGLSPERVAEIRDRVLQGAYNSVEVVDQVARRMLERGDI
jgi:anti-sigma28 factor (negative regulator of flagellin synthesis)